MNRRTALQTIAASCFLNTKLMANNLTALTISNNKMCWEYMEKELMPTKEMRYLDNYDIKNYKLLEEGKVFTDKFGWCMFIKNGFYDLWIKGEKLYDRTPDFMKNSFSISSPYGVNVKTRFHSMFVWFPIADITVKLLKFKKTND